MTNRTTTRRIAAGLPLLLIALQSSPGDAAPAAPSTPTIFAPASGWCTDSLACGAAPTRPTSLTPLHADVQIISMALLLSQAQRVVDLPDRPLAISLSPTRLNALDRTVVGNHSPLASRASDVLLWSHVALPFALTALEGSARSALRREMLVLAEVLTINAMMTTMFKFAVRRARPYTYDDRTSDTDRNKTGATLSFYSGHTSCTFAMATAFSYLYTKRNPGGRLVLPVWLLSHSLAATTGVLRVVAGRHFWSDVAIGALAGSAVGLVVPYLRGLASSERPASKLLANLRLAPSFHEGGFGVNAMVFW